MKKIILLLLVMAKYENNLKKILISFTFGIIFVTFACQQPHISRYQARRIGMDTLSKIFGKKETREKKPFELYKTDSTWVLHRISKRNKRYREYGGIIYVIMDKNTGKVIKIRVMK